MSYEIVYYAKSNGREPAREFLFELERVNRNLFAKVLQGLDTLGEYGPNTHMPLARYMEDGIYELRSKSPDGISRVFYFFFVGKKVVLTNGFVKKTQKTPPGELEKAKKYKKDYEVNYE